MNTDQIVDWVMNNTEGSNIDRTIRWQTYKDAEVRRLTDAAFKYVPQGGVIVEIGVWAGRSTAALLCVAREKGARVIACDPFVWQGDFAEPAFHKMLTHFEGVPMEFHRLPSIEARKRVSDDLEIDLLHIDGNHHDVATDCQAWLPNLKSGGVVVFHDVVPSERSNIYQVYLDVQKYTSDWLTLWWALDEDGCQMGRQKP